MDQPRRLRRVLGARDLVLFGLICMAPVAPFMLFGFVSVAANGAVVLPYVLGALGLGFTALSYASMAQAAPQAGSVYGYGRLAMGKTMGFLGGWAILLDYLLLVSLALLYAAIYLNIVLPALPLQLIVAGFLLLTFTVNLRGLQLSARLNLIINGVEIALGVAFIVASAYLLFPPGAGLTLTPLWPPGNVVSHVVAGTPLAMIAFLGFDAIATLAEEVRDPDPGAAIGRATLVALGLMLMLFVVIDWLLSDVGRGVAISDPAFAASEIFAARLPWLVLPLSITVALAFGAGSTAGHASVSRLGFAMARDGMLPKVLGQVYGARDIPAASVVAFGALIAIIAYLALPYLDVLTSLVSFGAITGFLFVNASVIVHFGIRQRSRRWFMHWISPSIGIAVLVWVMSGIRIEALTLGAAWMALGLLALAFGGLLQRRTRER